jgi:hypothetical protein
MIIKNYIRRGEDIAYKKIKHRSKDVFRLWNCYFNNAGGNWK